MLLALVGRRLMPLPLPLRELTRITLATAAMTAAVIAFPAAHTTLGLLQSCALGAAIYGVSAVALNVLGARDLARSAARTATRRFQPVSSTAHVD